MTRTQKNIRASALLGVFVAMLAFDGTSNAAFRRLGRTRGAHDPHSILVRRKIPTAENAPRIRGARLARREAPFESAAPHARRERFEKFALPSGVSVEAALAELTVSQPELEVAPDIQMNALRVPNDTLYPQSWGLKNTGQTVSAISPFLLQSGNPGTAGMDIGAEDAWDFQSDCSSVVVAVIDSGVNYDHDELAANMWVSSNPAYPNHGYDFFDNDNDPSDLYGHGTHVAAIIGAVGDNAQGSTGVCWNVQIMAVRALGPTGNGSTSAVISAIDFAVANGAKVINLSLGAAGANAPLEQAVADAEAADVVVVSAAGNDGDDNDASPMFPCNAGTTGSLCVAALAQDYTLASFSNYGATKVDVGAPGTNVLSNWNGTVTENHVTMDSGWTFTNPGSDPFAWGYATASLVGGGTAKVLVNPKNFLATPAATYEANSKAGAYMAIDAAGADVALLQWEGAVDTETPDAIHVRCAGAGGDPYPSGTEIFTDSGRGGLTLSNNSVEIPGACQTSSATFGFQLESNATTQGRGLALIDVTLQKTVVNNVSYAVVSGTSQATPHVAGVAALLRAFRPTASAARVVEAIKNSGRTVAALNGKTTSGKAVHALGALSYLAAPTDVTTEIAENP